MRHFATSPATDRLEWILDGLNGGAGWGGDAAEALAPAFAALVPPEEFVRRVRLRAAAFGPVSVIGLDTNARTARARARGRDGMVRVVTCAVEPDDPHRITATRTTALVPEFTAPRLPADFSETALGQGSGSRLIVFSGLPGTGKSTLADAAGRRLGIPVFATDWLLGSLTPFGGYHLDGLLGIGAELLTTLAFRQLSLGQSAILDHPAEDTGDRTRWRTLAEAAGAEFRVVVCTCSDPRVHQSRLEKRERGIPGWHQGGNWDNVRRRLAAYPPWSGEALTTDSVRPLEENLAAVLCYVAG